MIRIGVLLLALLFAMGAHAAPISDGFWSEWSEATFARAAREHKFVVVSLQSWWCKWCHVMNEETWSKPEVRAVLKDHFIPVYVDQDSRPDISQRYERWGWPATIIFGPDGKEIAKLRGFYSAQFFIPVLTDTIKDPTPVDYGDSGPERGRTLATGLSDAQRNEILSFVDGAWNKEYGGWSKSKFVDGPMLVWALQRARQGDRTNEARIRKVLTLMADTMIDKGTGGMNQVNLKPDWSEPAREFPMFAQEAALTAFARAAVMFGDPAYRQAADRIYGFLKNTMAAPGGGFYASMGLSEGEPGVDKRQYTRETAQAVSGLLAYYDATGIVEARELAVAGARWALAKRAPSNDGGFRHAEQDKGGPYLADNVEMAKALLALHRSTGERAWLDQARATADFIAKTFVDSATGGFIASASPEAQQLVKPIKQREDNVTAVRMFSLLSSYTGKRRYREIAEAGMGYLTSPPILDAFGFLPDVLLAEDELRNEPVHVTIVGAKDDPRSALYTAALAYPLVNKRAEWWDKRQGKLANIDVDYPDYPDGPAAFACTSTFCSYPVTEPGAIAAQLDSLKRARKL
ncbi:DUF255 domain-containing protein [Bradyrhizobium sp. Ash2021]|uniref:DUF255 domain-containing protein n=1 Tax=Bradyrhizobium sp. Ash2021 TaxID=2954771 RepID=UPI002814F4EE|nr:DUF255 domain-containing protein [Bradyrhizobium sp. Ash2021]WMT79693.1 DUF255 domain-containing protein [Bradyrhizobium sp. Ash2021]